MKNFILKSMVLIFLIWGLINLLPIQGHINEKLSEAKELTEQLSAQKLINASLKEAIESEKNEKYSARMGRLARERLGLIGPGEILIINKTP